MILTNLANIRKSRDMTQKKLAELVLLSERTIIALENGGSTTENNAKRLAIILGVRPRELIAEP